MDSLLNILLPAVRAVPEKAGSDSIVIALFLLVLIAGLIFIWMRLSIQGILLHRKRILIPNRIVRRLAQNTRLTAVLDHGDIRLRGMGAREIFVRWSDSLFPKSEAISLHSDPVVGRGDLIISVFPVRLDDRGLIVGDSSAFQDRPLPDRQFWTRPPEDECSDPPVLEYSDFSLQLRRSLDWNPPSPEGETFSDAQPPISDERLRELLDRFSERIIQDIRWLLKVSDEIESVQSRKSS